MTARNAIALGIVVALVAAGAFLVWASAPSLDPVDPPTHASFAADVVKRGARLAALGDCIVCHTAVGGAAYAGGRPLETPFGVLYGTNITPAPERGIGRWSEAAFVRAMRAGLDREGRHLYPAFPYDHFRLIGDDDLHALYAYIMTREPVDAAPPPNRLRFPFNVRPLVAVWKALYLDRGRVERDGARDAAWQRGAYLVAGVAHCGACHTPRNRLGAEELDRAYEGGEAEGWDAPALTRAFARPWQPDDLQRYLRGALPHEHGGAAGPMAPVTRDLAQAADADVQAIVAYVGALRKDTGAAAQPPAGATASEAGRALYEGACAACHEGGRDAGGALDLANSSLAALPSPRNLFRVILHGLAPQQGERGPWMPAFAGAFSDAETIELAQYVRGRFAHLAPWSDPSAILREVTRTPDERAVSGGP